MYQEAVDLCGLRACAAQGQREKRQGKTHRASHGSDPQRHAVGTVGPADVRFVLYQFISLFRCGTH